MATLVWFRDDLRIADHPALSAAAEDPDGMVLLYLLDEESSGARPLGGAARWWLHGSLAALQTELAARGVPLVLRRGAAAEAIPRIIAESGVDRVLWNRRYGDERHADAELKASLRASGVEAHSFVGGVLHEPGTILTEAGRPYRVYSPFWRACVAAPEPAVPLDPPTRWSAAKAQPASEVLDDWELRPTHPDWADGLAARWEPGERAAAEQLERFLDERASEYAAGRDFPAEPATSELSPHLRWGEISPRQVWHRSIAAGVDVGTFLSELGWREFAWHTAFHRGALHERGIDPRFDAFPWRSADVHGGELRDWVRGRTGFGLVDAGMRELWATGFMHNRVRMVAASFLTKNLLIDWREGERWFWDTLVDADAASNPFNWQWVAGCGVDAAPYFRIFNPETQQRRFDPDGRYVERWASDSLLVPGIVDLRESRIRALAAYDAIK